MAQHTKTPTTNGLMPEGLTQRPLLAQRGAPAAETTVPAAQKTLRILTANVQSYPPTAITLDQAREDLRANAADGDLVMLQEIDKRYRQLVFEEFPSNDWHVSFGPKDNESPIAARKDIFDLLDEQTLVIHPPRAGLHGRRYLTHVHLRHRELGVELHATNVHLTAGAFSRPPPADAASRQAEWREGMQLHDRFIEGLIATGSPVVGGGDYNRRLRAFQSQAAMIGGRPVAFGVDTASIDLLWFIDGTSATWTQGARTMFRSRDGQPPMRNSDHAARRAVAVLTSVPLAPNATPTAATAQGIKQKKNKQKERKKATGGVSSFEPQLSAATSASSAGTTFSVPFAGPSDAPFELTTFGDINPKRVDWKTRAALEETERRLGYRLTLVQGSYNSGKVKASGGTHDGGGVVDLLAWDWRRKVTVLRDVGFAAWHRAELPGTWGEHIHAVLVDHGNLSSQASNQVIAYRHGRDGLAGNRVDDFLRPSPIPVFSYPPAAAAVASAELTGGDGGSDAGVGRLGQAFPPRRTLDGVDISHHQSGRLDLTAAKAAGLRWWYVKATEGTSFKDQTYRKRIRQARSAGLPVGAYHFARPENRDAEAEARFFLKNIDLRAGDMVPMLDLEDIGDLTLAQLTAWTGDWVRTVTQELRRRGLAGRPIIYTPFNLEKGFGCLLWVARYSDDFRPPVIPRPWRRAAIWQHSNGKFGPVKNVPGLGPVDVNALHPDVPLSALRLRPAGRPTKPATGRRRQPVAAPPVPVAPVVSMVPQAPVASVEAMKIVAPVIETTTSADSVVQPLGGNLTTPTVTTRSDPSTPAEPGSLVITVTVPLPAAPAPALLMPDLGPLEEQLALAARGLMGAIDSLPERPES